MNRRILQITIFLTLFISIFVYGWGLFQKLSYNRLVFESNIYDYISDDATSVVNFNRNYYFDEYFQLDSTNRYLLDPIKEEITYPLAIIQFEEGEDLLLMKATKEQEESIKKIFHQSIAPFHAPKVKKLGKAELMFYSLSNNEFIITTFYKGIFAISKNYIRIEELVNDRTTSTFFSSTDDVLNFYTRRLRENVATSFYSNVDSTTFALAYLKKDSTLKFEGEYFGKLKSDSLKLSYNEMNSILRLTDYYTDSIDWCEGNKIQIWINKLRQ